MKVLIHASMAILFSIMQICGLAYAGNFDEDELKIKELISHKVDVKKFHEIKFRLSFPNNSSANRALADAKKLGFKVSEISNSDTEETVLWVSKVVIPEIKKIKLIHDQLIPIAQKYSGEYQREDWTLVEY